MKRINILVLILAIANSNFALSTFKPSKILFNKNWQLEQIKCLYNLTKELSGNDKKSLDHSFKKNLNTSILKQILNNPNQEVFKYLIEQKSEPDKYEINFAFNQKIKNGDLENAKKLLKFSLNLSDKDIQEAALLNACEIANLKLIKLLIAEGANVNAKDQHGQSALEKLIRAQSQIFDQIEEYYETLELLLKKGADTNYYSDENSNNLIYSINKYNYKIAQLLINHGANINFNNDEGNYPLSLAILIKPYRKRNYKKEDEKDWTNLIKLLVKKGAKYRTYSYEHQIEYNIFPEEIKNLLDQDKPKKI